MRERLRDRRLYDHGRTGNEVSPGGCSEEVAVQETRWARGLLGGGGHTLSPATWVWAGFGGQHWAGAQLRSRISWGAGRRGRCGETGEETQGLGRPGGLERCPEVLAVTHSAPWSLRG